MFETEKFIYGKQRGGKCRGKDSRRAKERILHDLVRRLSFNVSGPRHYIEKHAIFSNHRATSRCSSCHGQLSGTHENGSHKSIRPFRGWSLPFRASHFSVEKYVMPPRESSALAPSFSIKKETALKGISRYWKNRVARITPSSPVKDPSIVGGSQLRINLNRDRDSTI